MNKNRIDSIFNVIVAIIFLEFTLGGLGHLFGYPVRNVLFIVGVLSTLFVIYINKITIKKIYLYPIAIVFIYLAYGSIVGLVNGNSFRDIFSDANSFLGIIYLLLLVAYFSESTKKINKALSIFVNGATIVAIITIGLFFYSRLYLPNDESIIVQYMTLNDRLHYGFISGLVHSNNYARVYLFNGIFMQLAASILFLRVLNKNLNNKAYNISKLTLLVVGIYVSSTRGFWIAAIGAIVILLAYYLWKGSKNSLTLRWITIPLGILIIVIAIIPKTIVAREGILSPTPPESAGNRLESIVDFEGDPSNKIRAIQLEFLMKKFKEKPLLGAGFGGHIYEYTEYMIENNYPPALSGNFELYYIELLFKTGIIGVAIIFAFLLYNFIKIMKLLIQNRMKYEDEEVLVGWSVGCISILASTVTNPYLASLSVFFVLVMEVYLVQLYYEKYYS